MDYSLLLGVRRLKVTLKPKNTMVPTGLGGGGCFG